jgi:hypothetical protein
MKKLLWMLPLLLATSVLSNDLTATWTHTYVAADTVVTTGKFTDTVYTPFMPIGDFRRFWFQFTVDGREARQYTGYKDTARANDSVAFVIQTTMGTDVLGGGRLPSYNPSLANYVAGSCVPGSADLDTTIVRSVSLGVDSTVVIGEFMRAAFIVKDSSAAARAGLVGNTYGTRFIVNIAPKK